VLKLGRKVGTLDFHPLSPQASWRENYYNFLKFYKDKSLFTTYSSFVLKKSALDLEILVLFQLKVFVIGFKKKES